MEGDTVRHRRRGTSNSATITSGVMEVVITRSQDTVIEAGLRNLLAACR